MTHCAGSISGKKLRTEKKQNLCPTCQQPMKIETGVGFGAESKEKCPNSACDPFRKSTGRNGFGNI